MAARPAAPRGGDPDASEPYDAAPESAARTSRSTCPPASSAIPGSSTACGRRCDASALPPSALLLELTESLLLGGNEQIRADLNELKEIGVRLAIDDFGTGYSSLSYLLELPIDVLKIDKTFVTGIASSWRRHALVEGIVRLARTLEVEVIAEGIETETERELLAGMGCQFGQGYLLSVPVDADAAAAMLEPRPRPGHRAAAAAAQEPGRTVPHRPVSARRQRPRRARGSLARCGPAVWRPSATACLPSSSRSWCSSCASPTGSDLAALWHATGPGLLSYLLSFVYVGIYWTNHHHMFQLTAHVTGGDPVGEPGLLFFLSLFPFTTQWMDTTHFARTPVVVYGVNLLAAGVAYYVLQWVIIRSQGHDSALRKAIGSDFKGKISPVVYIAGCRRGPARRRRHRLEPPRHLDRGRLLRRRPPSCGSSPTAASSAVETADAGDPETGPSQLG